MTQSLSDLQVKNVKTQWLPLGEWGCPLNNDPKLVMGQLNSSLKKVIECFIQYKILQVKLFHLSYGTAIQNAEDTSHL